MVNLYSLKTRNSWKSSNSGRRMLSGWLGAGLGMALLVAPGNAQETLPWQQKTPYQQAQNSPAPDPYVPASPAPANRWDYGQANDAYKPAPQPRVYRDQAQNYGEQRSYPQTEQAPQYDAKPRGHIQPYQPQEQYPRQYGSNEGYRRDHGGYDDRYDNGGPMRMPHGGRGTYSENEVVDAGHRFFGSLSTGLAKAIQWAFKKSGRPNGYILGEDAGGAFVAGLRYGEGKLYTKDFGVRRVFWQGPSIGYDFGGDGNRTMTLVYNLRSPHDVFRRFAGVQGSAYLVGGVSVQFLTGDDITLAPIRTGVGLRLGANIGYLKYTRRPTWNPF